MDGPGLHLGDCMEAMKHYPDGYFDLAIVDPPYGGGGVPTQKMWGGYEGGLAVGLTPTTSVTRTGGGYYKKYRQRTQAAI